MRFSRFGKIRIPGFERWIRRLWSRGGNTSKSVACHFLKFESFSVVPRWYFPQSSKQGKRKSFRRPFCSARHPHDTTEPDLRVLQWNPSHRSKIIIADQSVIFFKLFFYISELIPRRSLDVPTKRCISPCETSINRFLSLY